MKVIKRFDSRWGAPVRAPFRVGAMVLAILFLAMGALGIVSALLSPDFTFDSNTKFDIAAIAFGVFLLIIAIRGRLSR